MSFDYRWTCPEIDYSIAEAKSNLEDGILDILQEASPLLGDERIAELAEAYSEAIYKDLEDVFEATRATNEGMRKEAETQVDALEGKISELEKEVAGLEAEVARLEEEDG